MDGLMEQVGRLPRLTRIILSMVITVVLTVTVWLLITLVFGTGALDSSSTRLVLIFVVGVPLYAYGWWVLVGFDQAGSQKWRADQQSVWYLGAGCIGFVLAVALILVTLASSDLL